VHPFEPERASVLVTTGPYARTRNPMYVGLAGLLVAHAVVRASWTALVPVGVFVVIDRRQIAPEEAALLRLFGAEFEAYRSAVPRWLDQRSVAFASLG
jgi:protein-S-isoprenylcysteine O-methyltransferase Ste14